MTFERTTDLELVRWILTRPEIYPHIGDDYAPPVEQFTPNADPRIWWVVARSDGQPMGLFLFLPISQVCWEAHVSMLRWAWGPLAMRAVEGVIPWIFDHTTAQRLVASIAATNRLAIRYAERAGFTRFGVNGRSCMKGGVLIDQVCLGLSKG